jgi:hypothetical protein
MMVTLQGTICFIVTKTENFANLDFTAYILWAKDDVPLKQIEIEFLFMDTNQLKYILTK